MHKYITTDNITNTEGNTEPYVWIGSQVKSSAYSKFWSIVNHRYLVYEVRVMALLSKFISGI